MNFSSWPFIVNSQFIITRADGHFIRECLHRNEAFDAIRKARKAGIELKLWSYETDPGGNAWREIEVADLGRPQVRAVTA